MMIIHRIGRTESTFLPRIYKPNEMKKIKILSFIKIIVSPFARIFYQLEKGETIEKKYKPLKVTNVTSKSDKYH